MFFACVCKRVRRFTVADHIFQQKINPLKESRLIVGKPFPAVELFLWSYLAEVFPRTPL